ncbi:MAG: hypothetical protein ACN6OP_17185 [Pseudomonadales bacterium]
MQADQPLRQSLGIVAHGIDGSCAERNMAVQMWKPSRPDSVPTAQSRIVPEMLAA